VGLIPVSMGQDKFTVKVFLMLTFFFLGWESYSFHKNATKKLKLWYMPVPSTNFHGFRV